MPTNDRRSAADMTTAELADSIRKRRTIHANYAASTRPATDELATILRKRLSHIPTGNTGEILIHLGCFLTDALPLFQQQGLSPALAAQFATNIIVMAGVDLYDARETPADTAAQLQRFLTHFRDDDDTEIVDYEGGDALTVGMLRAATARLEQPPAHPGETPGCDSYAHPDYIGDRQIQCELPDGHFWHRNGQRTWTP